MADPVSLVLSAAMLLGWLGDRHDRAGYRDAARAIDSAADALLAEPALHSPDLGGRARTDEMAAWLCERLASGAGGQ